MVVNDILRKIFYWPIRITANCNPIPFEPLKHIRIDPKKEIAYVMVSSSVGNMLTAERLTEKLGWPSPFGRIRIGSRELPRTAYMRSPSFFSANAKVCDISDMIFEWFDACHEADTDLQVIPITVLWSQNPGTEGKAIRGVDAPTPGWRKFLTLTFAGRDNCTIISNPLSAMGVEKRLLSISDEDLRRKTLNRLVTQHFENEARAIIGRPFPDRTQMLNTLMSRPGTIQAIEEYMEKTGANRAEAEQAAFDIFNVMAADTRYPLLRFFNCIISMVWSRIYHGQTILGADKVRDLVMRGYEVIYIPCHRSHMDYIMLLFAIFHEGLPIPQIASGDNLNFFPAGTIIRRCGGYFIRRKMKGDNFYISLFREYMFLLFEKGYATEFFIEGGRSRTGRTLPPRTGMVSMTVQAQLRKGVRPIVFVPTYLGYEHVTEVGSYMHELDGAKKKKESFTDLFGIFKRLRYYGRGYIIFGNPVKVPDFLDKHVPNWHDDVSATGIQRPDWLHDTVEQLSHQIIINLNDSASVNGINLCALAIIGDRDHTLSLGMLKRCLRLYIMLLSCDKSRFDTMPTTDIDTLISQALELKKFRVYDVGEDMKFVRPSRGQTLQLTYFQNNILHLFALPALVASILIRNGHIDRKQVISSTRSLFYFLRHELFAPVTEKDLDGMINKYIDIFLQGGYIVQHDGDILTLSGDGFEELLILASSIRLNLIRYIVAVIVLKQVKDNTVGREEFLQLCAELCRHVPSEITGNSPEFADPIMFKIMFDTFVRHNYFSLNEKNLLTVNPRKVEKLSKAASPLLSEAVKRELADSARKIKHHFEDLKKKASVGPLPASETISTSLPTKEEQKKAAAIMQNEEKDSAKVESVQIKDKSDRTEERDSSVTDKEENLNEK